MHIYSLMNNFAIQRQPGSRSNFRQNKLTCKMRANTLSEIPTINYYNLVSLQLGCITSSHHHYYSAS